ncbi:glycosyltransferase family 2 protein [Microbacterium sp. SORGH_AS_0888]|uniref:glycosyltransferase family 2 protein n=1 Tax=Microbacterium sp. SORGH_AS_0888 TaxID=3041791 RepID=UPI0027804521|nr:glycosyltransferase family 2 protein [Microbacterium sp. SORGH_AS_0888]MDQ1127879.1 glycosyltransferase involved in cell wall biosynthesis [Microbacterium sp. SORGH_AS_0888]
MSTAVPPRPRISIVTPCYNEESNVERCAAEVRRVMTEQLPDYDYEHFFCDNASTDETVNVLKRIAAADPSVKVIVNSRNVGPFRNMANGLRSVTGDLVVPMIPADLQDPPDVVPQMVAKLTDRVDVVYGVRTKRKDPLWLAAGRALYYWAARAGGGSNPPSHAGEFLLARRHIIQSVNEVAGSYPYIRGLVAQTNPRWDKVEYEWGIREHGRSRNSLPDLIDQGLNGLISTARAPIRWSLLLGIVLAIAGVIAAVVNVGLFLFGNQEVTQGIPTLIVGMFFFGGLQLFFLGLIGEYVVSIHQTIRPAPPMVEVERINC